MRFRKKPVVIEASHFDGSQSARDHLINWMGNKCRHTAIDDDGCLYETENLFIRTLEGEMMVSVGDWVIKGTSGEFYPCKPDIFVEVYEPELPEYEE